MLGENGARSEDEVGGEEGPGHAGLVGHGQAWGRGRRPGRFLRRTTPHLCPQRPGYSNLHQEPS